MAGGGEAMSMTYYGTTRQFSALPQDVMAEVRQIEREVFSGVITWRSDCWIEKMTGWRKTYPGCFVKGFREIDGPFFHRREVIIQGQTGEYIIPDDGPWSGPIVPPSDNADHME
jgi:hypothetical protein